MLIPCDEVNILNTFSYDNFKTAVTNLHLKLLVHRELTLINYLALKKLTMRECDIYKSKFFSLFEC